MGVDRRVRRSVASIQARVAFLQEVLVCPDKYQDDHLLKKAVVSQGAFAKYQNAKAEILACSLNTLKNLADDSISGGFQALDMLRVRVKEATAGVPKVLQNADRKTKAGLEKQVVDLKRQVGDLKEDLEILTWALSKSLAQARNYAAQTKSGIVQSLCRKEHQELLIMIASRQRINIRRSD